MQSHVHGVLVAEQLVYNGIHVGGGGIMGIHHKGNGACILVEGVEHIGAAADAQIITGWFVLALQNVLGHHPEGGHVAQLPDVCLG